MSTIKGIFEPFYPYVTTQLKIRKALIGNGAPGTTLQEQNEENKSPLESEPILSTTIERRRERGTHFLAYTTEKQCTIRMASGVDVRKTNTLLNEYEGHLTGPELARNWVLEGGVKGFNSQRSGFNTGQYSTMEGEAYGDISIRSDAADSFGIVPMPGIVDATIDTKSDNGSLREATVNFVCHNRRQLEILETLYMRPGYPILLEWGWTPYISNPLKDENPHIERDIPTILDSFMDASENLTSLNNKIFKNKKDSSGNYDGFIGFCKNFSFKVREDGGYDCITEIIAHGEILESLRTQITLAPKILTSNDALDASDYREGIKPKEYESIDKFLFYLRAIKTNLDTAGTQASLNYLATNREFQQDFHLVSPKMYEGSDYGWGTKGFLGKTNQGSLDSPLFVFGLTEKKVDEREELIASTFTSGTSDGVPLVRGRSNIDRKKYIYYGYKNDEGKTIPINTLNDIDKAYGEGYNIIEDLVKDITKVTPESLKNQKQSWQNGLHYLDTEEARNGTVAESWFKLDETDYKEHVEAASLKMRKLHTAGLDPILEGTILKELSVEDENLNNSGIRKKIFVRWDLICQILNKKVTPQYKKDHALVELTYLNPNQPTFHPDLNDKSTATDGSKKHPNPTANYYLDYSTKNIIFEKAGADNFDLLKKKKQEDITTKDLFNLFDEASNDSKTVTNSGFSSLGQSFDRNVCLMPHQIGAMKKSQGKNNKYNVEGVDDFTINPLTSFSSTKHTPHSIGMVYFNLDYLISTYEELVLETFKTDENGVEKTKQRLKDKFSFHDWITTIWNGVNDACGGYYNFGLHTEHSRPHIARIIDFTFSGTLKDIKNTGRDLFSFDPQGLGSISRESSISSKIDNDFASVISIAAQSPDDIHSLDAMSFKAFHKNIKNRFTARDEQGHIDNHHTDMEIRYKQDIKIYNNAILSLQYYLTKMNQSNYETELVMDNEKNSSHRKAMSPNTAKSMASRIEEMYHKINMRYGELENGQLNNTVSMGKGIIKGKPYVGTFRVGTTFNRSSIIPITVSMTLDGIGGIHPLQIFKINPKKLPKDYQDPNIIFIVKKETQKITAGQDWTTSLEGYLTFINDNPNFSINSNEYLNKNNNYTKKKLDIVINKQRNPTMEKPPIVLEYLNIGTRGNNDTDFNAKQSQTGAKKSMGVWRIFGETANHFNDWNPSKDHYGVDLHAPKGTSCFFPVSGRVIQNSPGNSTSGQVIAVKRDDGMVFWSGHLDKRSMSAFIGKTVKAGDYMGDVGNSGNASNTHSHIHFNIYDSLVGDFKGGTVNPLPYLESVYPTIKIT